MTCHPSSTKILRLVVSDECAMHVHVRNLMSQDTQVLSFIDCNVCKQKSVSVACCLLFSLLALYSHLLK